MFSSANANYYKIMKLIILYSALISCMLMLGGCEQMASQENEKSILTINDIAYNVNKKLGFTVYISENERYVPYLVLTNDYNGRVLLLREYLLSEPYCIKDVNWEGSGGSYYPESDVDLFLNKEYISTIPISIQNVIFETEVIVTTAKSLQKGGGFAETEKIKRKAFVLSATELGIKSGMANTEGKSLKYFKDTSDLIATDENGESHIYWIRTPYLVDDIKTWTVSYDGSWGSCPVALKQMIRPAFCISKDATIKEISDIIDGRTVYVLE